VYIALPNHMHREYTERAARMGVHVLCEKPLAVTMADCQAMIAVAVENNIRLMVAYRLHFEEANLRAMEIVRGGQIGDAQLFSGVLTQQVRPGDIRTRADAGGGALLDLGVYPINAARYIFDDEPIAVSAQLNTGRDDRFQDVDETVMALLRFPNGRLAQFAVSQGAAGVSGFQVIGSRGDLRVDAAFDYEGERRHVLTVEGKTKQRKFRPRDQFAPQLIYFARCIQEGLDPEPSGHEGLADIRVAQAIVEAAQSGRTVELEPWPRRRRPELSQLISKRPVRKPQPVHAQSPSVG
jgi:predicted dehydrogenase